MRRREWRVISKELWNTDWKSKETACHSVSHIYGEGETRFIQPNFFNHPKCRNPRVRQYCIVWIEMLICFFVQSLCYAAQLFHCKCTFHCREQIQNENLKIQQLLGDSGTRTEKERKREREREIQKRKKSRRKQIIIIRLENFIRPHHVHIIK